MRAADGTMLLVIAVVLAVSCKDGSPATAPVDGGVVADAHPLPPIASEPLTQRHQFTDDVAVQVRIKPDGRSREIVNISDASRMAVVRFTIQPGVRFPWHTHPGLVMVAVTQGELVFVYGDDCVQRRYPAGTAFVDPGFGNIHYAFNPTGGELVIVATFLGVPSAPAALTNPVAPAIGEALDAKCGAAPASVHSH
jgi:quercetin dioxygenase-like cupin family protein